MSFTIKAADVHRTTNRVDQSFAPNASLNLPLNRGVGAEQDRGSNPTWRLITVIRRVIFVVAHVHDQHRDDVVLAGLQHSGRARQGVRTTSPSTEPRAIQPNS